MTADVLEAIVAAARHAAAVREAATPAGALDQAAVRRPDGEGFARALRETEFPRIIAECKRRSPSRGILRRDYDPATHARAYERAGAAAISVLTEPTFFDGAPSHLADVRAAIARPLLRKDFIVTPYQVAESAAIGADAILLIAGALSNHDLRALLREAGGRGLAALVEVHDRIELDRALGAGASVIGVNSRNLRTLEVDRRVLEDLIGAIPPDVTAVAESGLRNGGELERLSRAGYHAFLVGERLITEDDPGAALRALRAGTMPQEGVL